jgi:hypothetical protein
VEPPPIVGCIAGRITLTTARLSLLRTLHAGSKRRRFSEKSWRLIERFLADEIQVTEDKNTSEATLARVLMGARQEDAIREFLGEKIRRGLLPGPLEPAHRWLAGKVLKGLASKPPRAGGLQPTKLPSLPKVRDVLKDIEREIEMKNRARICPQDPTAPNTLVPVVTAKAA